MSKILLISSNLFTRPYPVYPLGMAIVASALSERGHIVQQYDSIVGNNPEDRLRGTLGKFAPHFVGISIRNIDNEDSLSHDDSWCLLNEKRLISLIRQCTDAPIILGGAAFSAMPEEILDHVGADYGVVGEGERIICDLIDTLEKGQTAQKILYSSNIPLKGAEMCSPMWEKDLMDFYVIQSGMIGLQTKRGCPYKCSYCVYPCLEGTRFRFREPEAVIDDLGRLQAIYNVDTVFFTDSIFNDPDHHYLELAEKMILSGRKIRWAGYFRPKGIGSKELELLKRSGLFAVEVGTDAGCDETLSGLKKGFHFDDVIQFNSACIKAQMPSAHFIIFGGPGETEKTLNEGLKNIRLLEKIVVFAYSGARILPGTDLHLLAIREGLLSEKAPLLKPVYYFSTQLDRDAMNRALEKEANERREFVFPPERGRMTADAMNVIGYKGLLWDKMVSFSDSAFRRKRKT